MITWLIWTLMSSVLKKAEKLKSISLYSGTALYLVVIHGLFSHILYGNSLALGQSCDCPSGDCPSGSEMTLKDMINQRIQHSGNHVLSSWENCTIVLCVYYWGIYIQFVLSNDSARCVFVRRAGLLWSQQDFEWRWSVPLFKCLTVLEFSFILFDLCLLITFFNFIMNYVPIVTFWIFTYHKIWILSIMFCSIWSYWIIYFLACLEVSWRVVS